LFAACVVALGVTACGDDAPGNNNPTPPPPPPLLRLEGLYSGSITQPDFSLSLLVLEDATIWGVYASRSAVPVASGVVQSAGVRNNATGTYTGSPDGRNYFSGGGQVGQISGSYTAADVFTGFVPGVPPPVLPAPWGFSTIRVGATTYDYDSAAQLATIAADWGVVTPRGGSNLTISATGAVVAGSVAGCQVSGNFTPRAGGKNVFNASLTFGPPFPLAVCDIDGPASGVAVVTLTSPTRRQLMVAVQNPQRTLGVGFFGDAPR
jgi:hypothetical protein